MELLRIDVDGGRAALAGELDASQRGRLLSAFAHVEDRAMTVSLAGLTFVDSAGFRALVDLRAAHPQLRLAEPSRATQRIAQIVQPDHHGLLYEVG